MNNETKQLAETEAPDKAPTPPGRFCLVAAGDETATTYPLPEEGTLTLGSSESCDLPIADQSVAPEHARLYLGNELRLEDMGSEVGTFVRGDRLPSGQPTSLGISEPFRLGNVALIVQRRALARPRRIWTAGYFELRLEEECVRAERERGAFALLRLVAPAPTTDEFIEQVLANALRLTDVIGRAGARDYQALLLGCKPEQSHLVSERVLAKIPDAAVRFAFYPLDGRNVVELQEKAAGTPALEEEKSSESVSDAMKQLYGVAERIAGSDLSVLIFGETGVGKERMAEAVHRFSHRATQPFVRINCAAIPEPLLESELFGHERGAFTGAAATKRGLFESAAGGTVFLDEVGELPMSMQVKLLRVLEERLVRRVGGLAERPLDVRFISATNRDLELEVRLGRFREDLYYRLCGVSLIIPPLRERPSEIESLALHFVNESCARQGRPPPTIDAEAMNALRTYRWPGNIRELRNTMERAVALSAGLTVGLHHLPLDRFTAGLVERTGVAPAAAAKPSPSSNRVPPPEIAPRMPSSAPRVRLPRPSLPAAEEVAPPTGETRGRKRLLIANDLRTQVKLDERRTIMEALAACAGNQTTAAKLLGISRRTLLNLLDEHQVPRPRKNRRVLG